ncbi:5-dehydro-4-deoxyglucarate dehydratase [Lentzea sp. NPDC051213]|uniref:5-dehydro-4-deoxyglucarate dehydratase n=1 Tax=Lentzea sp. NPDC051213 TaxID=3364126 RepID=UPI00379D3F7D
MLKRFEGVLFFPVTPFAADGSLDEGVLAEHIARGVAAGAGGVFAGCGTGEFHALSVAEVGSCAQVAVKAAAGRVPVFGAAGGPLPLALEQAHVIAEAGADGLLLLPPYLVGAAQAGLLSYVRAITDAVDLPVIFYQRGNAVLTPETAGVLATIPGVAGLKDGVGDLERLHRIVRRIRAVRPDFEFFNGLPTAELTAHAYRGIGIPLYSSAVFAFAPEISQRFHRALDEGDTATTGVLLDEFFIPLVELRDISPGFAVSLIKAGVRLRGLAVGGVRAPLLDPAPEHVARLEKLLERGLDLAAR